MSRTFTITIALALAALTASASAQSFFHESDIHVNPSPLASMSFLYHGFPEWVIGVNFAYSKKEGLDLERFLAAPIKYPSTPAGKSKQVAKLIATKIYRSNEGNWEPYLAMSRREVNSITLALSKEEIAGMSRNEKGLYYATKAYIRLVKEGRKSAIAQWNRDKKSAPPRVRTNVLWVLKEVKVVDKPGKFWRRPHPYR